MNSEIQKTLLTLKQGGVILYPTDTVWGLGCDALNDEAVLNLMKIKNRPSDKSFILLLDDENKLHRYSKSVPEVAYELIETTDKPITMIFDDAMGLSKYVVANDQSIAFRIIKKGFIHEVIKRFNKPIVSTSANLSGQETPIHLTDVVDDVKNRCDLVVGEQFSENLTGIPSTIIKFAADSTFKFIRK